MLDCSGINYISSNRIWRMREDGLPLLDIAGNLRTRYDWYGNLNDNGEEV
jgi:hypothetical protein